MSRIAYLLESLSRCFHLNASREVTPFEIGDPVPVSPEFSPGRVRAERLGRASRFRKLHARETLAVVGQNEKETPYC